MNRRCQWARAGFTLFELVIVTAILVTLVGVGFALVKRGLTQARIVESCANLRSLAIANGNYLSEHGVYCPADDRSNRVRWHGGKSGMSGTFDPKKGLLAPYLGKSERVGVCPLFREMLGGSESFEEGTGGYGYNAVYIGGRPGGDLEGNVYDPESGLRISERAANVSNPGRTVMFATTAYARSNGLQEYPYCEPPFWDFGSGPSGSRPSPSVHFRANGKALVAWCDGSVTAEPMKGREHGFNPHGGDSKGAPLGWFGPDGNNGYWNPRN